MHRLLARLLPPIWSRAVAGHGAGREAALPPSPFQAPISSQPRAFMPGAPPHPPAPPRTGGHRSSDGSREADPLSSSAPPPSTPAEADIPPWLEHKRTCPHALAETARDAIRQLHAWNADRPPAQEDASDITQALETDQNFPEPTPDGILPLWAAVGTVTGEPPDPQGWHPAVDYLALLNCLLPQLRDAEHAGAHVLLLVTDSRNFLSIPHFPYFIRHLVARMQWEGTYREKWFPIFVNTLEAGLAAVHFTWAGPEIMTVLRVLAPGAVLMLLDHDTLFTARWEAEELRRFAVLDLLPNSLSVEPLGKMDVEVDETQPCGSLPSSPWSCSPDGYIPSGARSPNSIGMVCASKDQLEANGGLVIFYPDAPDASCPRPPAFCIPHTAVEAVDIARAALACAFTRIILPSGVPTPLPGMPVDVTLDRIHHLQCLRNTPLAGTNANRHSDFVSAWALLGRYVHELAWKQANLEDSRPEPQIALGSCPVGQVKEVKTWGQGPYEQSFLPLLLGYGSSQTRMAILPDPDLFMANRFAEAVPPRLFMDMAPKGRVFCGSGERCTGCHPARGHLGQLPPRFGMHCYTCLRSDSMSLLEYRWRIPHWKRFASRIGCRICSLILCLFCSPDWLSKGIGMTRGPILYTLWSVRSGKAWHASQPGLSS